MARLAVAEGTYVVNGYLFVNNLSRSTQAPIRCRIAGTNDVAVLARAINGAGRIAKVLCETGAPDHIRDTCRSAMAVVGLDVAVLVRCLGEVEAEIRDLADVLHIDIIPSRVYELLAQEVIAKPLQHAGFFEAGREPLFDVVLVVLQSDARTAQRNRQKKHRCQ